MMIMTMIQDSANAASANAFLSRDKCLECLHHCSHTLIKLLVKLGTALLIGPAENYCPISSPVRLLIQKLFWASDEGFKIASCIAPRHDVSIPFKFGELLDGHCSF